MAARWRRGVGPDAPGHWWCRMRKFSTYDGQDFSIYVDEPVVCVAFGDPLRLKVPGVVAEFEVSKWRWEKGGCMPVEPPPAYKWKPLPRLRRGVRKPGRQGEYYYRICRIGPEKPASWPDDGAA